MLFLSILIFISFAKEDNEEKENNYIKWVDFNVTSEAMNLTAKLDIDSHNSNSEIKYNWIELLSYLACKCSGNFDNFKKSDLDNLINELQNGETIEELTKNLKYYNYYYEAYSAVLSNFIGNYSIEILDKNGQYILTKKYGIKGHLDIKR